MFLDKFIVGEWRSLQVYGNLSELASSTQKTNGHIAVAHDDAEQTRATFSLTGELRHWQKKKDHVYGEIFEPLAEIYAQAEAAPLETLETFIETAEFVLDGLWSAEPPYGQSRMRQLIDAIGAFKRFIF